MHRSSTSASLASPASTGRDEWRAGWLAVAGAAVGMATGAGLYQYLSSLFVEPLQAAFGWSRGEIATSAAISLLAALSAPLIGRLADRFGALRIAVVCVVALTIGYLCLAFMPGAIWQFMLASALIAAAAPGCTGLVYSRLVAGRFRLRRGLALGLMSAGLSLGALSVAPLLQAVIGQYGVRGGYVLLAVLSGGLGLPVILATLRSRRHSTTAADGDAASVSGLTLGDAVKSSGFWMIAAVMICFNIASGGTISQLAPMTESKGASPALAATLVSVFAGSVLVGRIGVGWLFDRLDANRVAAAVTTLSACGYGLMLMSAPEAAGLVIAIALIGLMQGAETDILAYFTARSFGLKAYNSIYGSLFALSMIATAVGIVSAGRLYDVSGDYQLPIGLALVLVVAAAAICLMFPKAPTLTT